MAADGRALVDFFSRSLTAFQRSPDGFRILCTLPHSGSGNPAPRRPPPPGLQSLVVLDSSFNPPTTAHALMAQSALRHASQPSRLLLLLAVNNADKAPQPASFPVRLGMMHAFARDLLLHDEGLQVDLGVTTMPFFHDKAKAMAAEGSYGQPEHVFLAGFDTLIRIFNPKYYGDDGLRGALGPFFRGARLRVTLRPDDEWGGTEEQMAWVRGLAQRDDGPELDAEWLQRVHVVEGVGEVVSSSRVRELVRLGRGDEVQRFVGEGVRGWIEREALYRE